MGNCSKKQSNIQRPHYKLLVIGMSGAGKTTTINMLVNQAMSIKYRQERKIAITQIVELVQANGKIEPQVLENNIEKYQFLQSDQLKQASDSQTTECNIYEVNNEDYDISFIDTPGLGDSEGSETDKRNQASIVDYIRKNIGISCVLYVHRSNETDNSLILNKYFKFLKHILPWWILENCIVCFTNVVTPGRIPAIEILEKEGVPLDRQIFFENDCLIPFDLIPFGNKIEQKQAYLSTSEQFWASNKEQFDSLISFLRKMPKRIRIQFPAKNQEEKLVMNQDEKIAMEKEFELKFKIQALMKMIHDCISVAEYAYRQKQLLSFSVENKQKYLTKFSTVNKQYNYKPSSTDQTVVVNQIQGSIQARCIEKLKEPVMFCYACLKICHNYCPTEELTENKSVNILKCRVFKQNQEKCSSCYHYSMYHSHTKYIPKDVVEPFGMNINQEVTYQQLQDSIQQDSQEMQQLINKIEITLSKAAYLQQEINYEISNHQFKYELMKEYIDYSKFSTQNSYKFTKEQQFEHLKELDYLNNCYQEIMKQNREPKLRPRQELKEKIDFNLCHQEIQREIKNLKEQYQKA